MLTQQNSVYTSVPLTKLSLAYRNPRYIAEMVAPTVQVVKDSGKIYSYSADNLRIVNTYRAVGGRPNIVETTVSSADHYVLEDHVLGEYIPEEVIENQESPINARVDVTEALIDRIWVDKEKALADVITNTSNITNNTTLSGTSQWSDYVNSDPITNIKDSISTIRTACGKMPNSMIIAWDVLNTLLFHPDMKDYFPGAPAITKQMLQDSLPRIFGLQQLLVGEALYNNANLGASDSLADIWTKDVVVAYIESSPSLKSQTFAATYQNKAPRRVEVLAQGQGGLETVQRKSEYLQVSDKYDQVLVNELCAYLIEAAIA